MKKLFTTLLFLAVLAAQFGFAQNTLSSPGPDDDKPKVLIFPNPLVGEDFKVKSAEQPTKIHVINAIGQTVYTNEQVGYSFDANYDVKLEQPEKGLYLVKIDYPNSKTVVKKLLVK